MGFANIPHFKHDLFKKYVTVFGSLFKDMTVERYDSSGNRVQTIAVPIAYAPKDKMLVRVEADPNLEQPTAVQLPRIGFEITSFTYDSTRKLNTLNKYNKISDADGDTVNYQYQSVPYDLTFSLYIMVKNTYDGVQLVEQILPFFTPDFTVSVNTIPEMSIKADVPIIFQSMVSEDVYEGDYDTRRALIYTLDFNMKAHIYGPVKNAAVIKKSIADVFVPSSTPDIEIQDGEIGTTAPNERYTVVPGLTSDGKPTNDASESIGYNTIKSTDPYGFIENTYFFQDGDLNPSTTGTLFSPEFGSEFK